jgi:hypothetical protein
MVPMVSMVVATASLMGHKWKREGQSGCVIQGMIPTVYLDAFLSFLPDVNEL